MQTTASAAGARARWVATAALIAAAVCSTRLALANFLLLIALVALWRAWRGRAVATFPNARALRWPMLAFVLVSLLSALASSDRLISFNTLPRLAVFLLVPVSAMLIDTVWWERLVVGLAVATGILAVWGIVQFLHGADDLENRIHGPLAHYMLYSGWLLLAVLVLLARVVLLPDRRALALLPPALLGIVALILTYTRNAWVGLVVGLLLLAAVWRRRLLLIYPLLALVTWVAAPRPVLDRMISTFDLRQHANYDRLCMWASGLEMVRDHPWLGLGPGMVPQLYPLYRLDDAPRWRVPHLHNNLLQIAAERGLPALAAYLWLIGAFFTVTWRGLPGLHGAELAAVASTLVAVVGITIAGLFEYNFWAAVVQYLTLVLMGAGVGLVERGRA